MNKAMRDRWFPNWGDAEKVQSDESNRQREVILGFLKHEGTRDFRVWLDSQIKLHRPKPGTTEDMLYALGTSDGLQFVKEHLDMLEREIRREDG